MVRKTLLTIFFVMISSNQKYRATLFSQYVSLRRTYKKDLLKKFKFVDAEILFWVKLDDENVTIDNIFPMVCHTKEILNLDCPHYITLRRTYRNDFLQISILADDYLKI